MHQVLSDKNVKYLVIIVTTAKNLREPAYTFVFGRRRDRRGRGAVDLSLCDLDALRNTTLPELRTLRTY